MPDLTTTTLAELRRLAEAATPTPWEWGGSEFRPVLRRVSRELSGSVLGCGALLGPTKQDAALIAAAVSALPALLDAAGRLAEVEAERDALAATVERVRALHPKVVRSRVGREMHYCLGCDEESNVFQTPWPCSTIRALDGEATP